MSTAILPPSATTGTTSAAPAGHSAMLATVADAPPAAARLDPGNIITGTVLGRDSQGHVTLRTDKGVLTLHTAANLPVGSTVAMEVRVAGTRLQVVVLSVEPPPGGAAQPWTGSGGASGGLPAPTGPALPAPAAAASPAAILAALTGGSPVMATVVHATQPAAMALSGVIPGAPLQAPAPALPQPAGALPTTLASMTAPALATPGATPPQRAEAMPLPGLARPAPAPVASTSFVPAPLTPGAPASAASPVAAAGPLGQGAPTALPPQLAPGSAGAASPPQLPSAALPLTQTPAGQPVLPAPLPVGVEVGLRIVGAALPGNPAPVAPTRPAGAPPLTTGLVIADTPAGHPVIDTPAGRMVLAVKAALPPGTLLMLELSAPAGLPTLAAAPASGAQDPAAMLRLARGWPALSDVLAALDEIDHPAGAELAARLPQAGPRLAAGLLTLMAQLMAGNVGEWLPPAMREALERAGKRDLVDRLRGEFQQLARLASEPAGGEWRVIFLPLLNGQELQQINLYLRGKRRGNDGEALDTGTRFVVEVDMTRLGPLQLDGLVQGRRFDLMLRSRKLLSPAMRRDIEAIFDDARAIGGYTGTIGFQVAASFPVAPLDQAKRKGAAAGVVV